MMTQSHRIQPLLALAALLWTLAIALFATPLAAQEGYPLTGTWSGNWNAGDRSSRLLVVIDRSAERVISGYIIENRKRIPLTGASLNPQDWSVMLTAQGQDGDGNKLDITVEGKIENLGSATQRMIVGTWQEGITRGDFKLQRN